MWPFKSKQVEQIAVQKTGDVRAAISGAQRKAAEAIKDEAQFDEIGKQFTLALEQLRTLFEQQKKVSLALKDELAHLDGAVKNIETTLTDKRNIERLTRFHKAKALCLIRDTGIQSVAGELPAIRRQVELIIGRSLGPRMDLDVINKQIASITALFNGVETQATQLLNDVRNPKRGIGADLAALKVNVAKTKNIGQNLMAAEAASRELSAKIKNDFESACEDLQLAVQDIVSIQQDAKDAAKKFQMVYFDRINNLVETVKQAKADEAREIELRRQIAAAKGQPALSGKISQWERLANEIAAKGKDRKKRIQELEEELRGLTASTPTA